MDNNFVKSSNKPQELKLSLIEFREYLDRYQSWEALDWEYKLKKSFALAKMNFAMRYGHYLDDSQLERLYHITPQELIDSLIKIYGKLKIANINAQYLQQCDSSQMSEFLEHLFADIVHYWKEQG